jgi:hypothetical protein
MPSSPFPRFAAPALALLAGACATGHQPLVGDRAAIGSTEVIAVIPQRALAVEPEPGPAEEDGLIPALIELLGPAAAAPETPAPLRRALGGEGFDPLFTRALDRALAAQAWLGARPASVLKEPGAADAALARARGDAVLFVRAAYRMSPDLSRLQLTARAWLVPNGERYVRSARLAGIKANPGSADAAHAAYRNEAHVEILLAEAGGGARANARRWAAHDGALLRSALSGGAQELANLVALDLGSDGRETVAAGSSIGWSEAQVLRADDGTLAFVAVVPGDTAVSVGVQAPHARAEADDSTWPLPMDAPEQRAPPAPAAASPLPPAPPAGAQPLPAVAHPPPESLLLALDAPLLNRPVAGGTALAVVPAGTTLAITGSVINGDGYWLAVRATGHGFGWLRAARGP